MRAILLPLLLSGCAHQFTADCAWGAENEADAQACAVQNFGAEAAAKRKKRMAECEDICAVLSDAPDCVVNCP